MICKLCYTETPIVHICDICHRHACNECYELVQNEDGTYISTCKDCKTEAEMQIAIESRAGASGNDASEDIAKEMGMEVTDSEIAINDLAAVEDRLREACDNLEWANQFDLVRKVHVICYRIQQAIELSNVPVEYQFCTFDPLPPDGKEALKKVAEDPEEWGEYIDFMDEAADIIEECEGKLAFIYDHLKMYGLPRCAQIVEKMPMELNKIRDEAMNESTYMLIMERVV